MNTSKDQSVLICITPSFPFGKGDEHFEDEIGVISKYFNQVIILSRSSVDTITRKIPENTTVIRHPFAISFMEKLSTLNQFNWNLLRGEIRFEKSRTGKKVPPAVLRLMVGSEVAVIFLYRKLFALISPLVKSGRHVYLYSYWNDLSAAAVAMVKKRIPVVKTFARAHAFEIYPERHPYGYIPFQQLKFETLDHIYFVSQYGWDHVKKVYTHLNLTHSSVSRLGCTTITSPAFHKDQNVIRILSVGYNFLIKRVDLMAKSLAMVQGVKVEWMYVGGAGKGEESIMEQVKEIFKVNPITGHFTGDLSREALREILRSRTFDLFLNLSPLEGLPVSMMEAMSAGIPVMATAVGGVPEIVRDNYNGVLLPPDPQVSEVATAIEAFHALDEEKQKVFRFNAKKTWEAEYNSEINYRVWIEDVLSK